MKLTPAFKITAYTNSDIFNVPYTLLQFSGGELHPTLGDYQCTTGLQDISISVLEYRPTFITELALLVSAIRADFDRDIKIDLDMPYIPYSRQDRVCSPGDAFGLKVFADQINSLNFRYVTVFDSHSDVAPALINNCIAREAKDLFILDNTLIKQYSHLVAPDAGAYKKVNSIASYFELPVIPALKTRDTSTGRVSNTILVTEGIETPTKLLVIDDIADGAYTFILLGKELKTAFPNIPVDLYVSHGIFSKGTDELKQYYDSIYCNNLFTPTEGVTILD